MSDDQLRDLFYQGITDKLNAIESTESQLKQALQLVARLQSEIVANEKRLTSAKDSNKRLIGQLTHCVQYLNRAHHRDKYGGYESVIQSANRAIYQKGRVTPLPEVEPEA